MDTNLKKYSEEMPCELKMVIDDAPRDDIDWALIMYLFKHSSPIKNRLYSEKNVITIGKVSNFFGLKYEDVYNRLYRMIPWCSVNTIYVYKKPVYICSITEIGVDAIFVLMELIAVS